MKARSALVLAWVATAALAYQNPDAETAYKRAQTAANAKQLATGMLIYCTDWDDLFPYVQDTKAAFVVTLPYLKSKDAMRTLNPNGGTFEFNLHIGGVNQAEIREPALTPMYIETRFWPDDQRIVAYANGRTKAESKADWPKVEKYLKIKFPRTAKKPLPSGDRLAKEHGVKF